MPGITGPAWLRWSLGTQRFRMTTDGQITVLSFFVIGVLVGAARRWRLSVMLLVCGLVSAAWTLYAMDWTDWSPSSVFQDPIAAVLRAVTYAVGVALCFIPAALGAGVVSFLRRKRAENR